MGTYFEGLVDRDVAGQEEAERLAQRVVDYLVTSGIIEPSLSDCVLGRDKVGYAPGRNWREACDEKWASGLRLEEYLSNGLEITTGRNVSVNPQGDFRASCPACHAEIPMDNVWAAVGDWYDGGAGLVGCAGCGTQESVAELDLTSLGVGMLTFTFWNWPQLSDQFVAKVGELLGHRVALISGKL